MISLALLALLQVGQWTSIPPLNVPRQELGVAAVEGRVYAIGGIGTDRQASKVVEIFDTRTGQWRPGPSLPIPMHHPNVAAVGSKICRYRGTGSGTVLLRSTVPIAVVALQIGHSGITTIPVTAVD